ncbi:ribosomal protein S18-domain-containing protein [Tribonema minus]|uniref:Ribosomal protein S18-domain-containing protein n=1 Tax=Tribonema minus TaxID=303371 RepID=A0A836CMS6_9STRA|nr:ribosomal protein S18-domain-containing protein [Tribonema minus]
MFDFTRSRPTQLAPGEVTPWIHKCPGHRQGKSGFSGRCEIFNQWDLHFQNVVLLKRFSSASAMIMPRRRTGLCARCQRKVARTVKRARHMGAIPYIGTYGVKVDTSASQPQARQTWGQQQSSTAAPVGSRFKSLSWDAERGLQ